MYTNVLQNLVVQLQPGNNSNLASRHLHAIVSAACVEKRPQCLSPEPMPGGVQIDAKKQQSEYSTSSSG